MNHLKNYIGEEIGKFEILNQRREDNKTYLYCRCKRCGKERWILQGNVKRVKCCEIKHSDTEFKALELAGQTINNILFIEKTDQRKRGAVVWKCKCFCGNIFYVPAYRIKNGEIKSCGCKRKVYREENFNRLQQEIKKNYVEGTYIPLIKKPKLRSNNKSGVNGVHKKGNRWISTIMLAGTSYRLGSFEKLSDAKKARKEGDKEYFEPIIKRHKRKETNWSCNSWLVSKIYKDCFKKTDNFNKIIIDLSVFKKYGEVYKNKKLSIKRMNELNLMLIDRFEKNHYIVYREGEYYTENNKQVKVKKGNAVAIKK